MKVNKTNTFNEVKENYRTQNILDENVLHALSRIDRRDFVPDGFENFSYSDIEIPLTNKQFMLRPSVEGMIIQSLSIKESDNVLIVGSGTGYLTSCISLLCNKIDAIDLYVDMVDQAQKNIEKYNLTNVKIENKNILTDWSMIRNYNIVIFTFGLDSNEMIKKNLSEYSKCFMFENKKNFPMKSGIIINKLSDSNFVKNFITQAYTRGIIKC